MSEPIVPVPYQAFELLHRETGIVTTGPASGMKVYLAADVDALERERDEWKKQYQACHVLHLEAQAECEEKNTFMLTFRAITAEQQLAAMTTIRDGLQDWINDMAKRFNGKSPTEVQRQLAAAQDSIRAWIERYTEAERQLATMTQERDTALLDSHALLAASEARVKALEEALRELVAANDEGFGGIADFSPLWDDARQALATATPTKGDMT